MKIYHTVLPVSFIMVTIMCFYLSIQNNRLISKSNRLYELNDSLKIVQLSKDCLIIMNDRHIYRMRKIWGIPDSIPFSSELMNKYPPTSKKLKDSM